MDRPANVDVGGGAGQPYEGPSYAPGDRIDGRYQLIRVLERGGMGVVWVAHHLALDVHVALKLIRPEAGSGEAARRLVREAQVTARIDHPAVLRVLDVGRTSEGDPFLVMELLEGECLADVLRRERRLAPVVAVRTILPIAEALAALHRKGIVHRDVKPENIFLAQGDSRRWQPKLIDFGAVKLGGRRSRSLISESEIAIGTPIYMSPEQIQGAEADARADVFALSVVLYEAIAGAPPFNRESLSTLIAELLAGDPRPLSDHGVRDQELWAIVERGLAPHAARWPSARDLSKALARWLGARGATADIGGVVLRPGRFDSGDGLPAVSVPALAAGATGIAAPDGTCSPRSPLAMTLGPTVVPRPASAPPVAGRGPRRVRLALCILAVVVAVGAIVANRPARARPPGAATAPPGPADAPRPSVPPRATGVPPGLEDPLR